MQKLANVLKAMSRNSLTMMCERQIAGSIGRQRQAPIKQDKAGFNWQEMAGDSNQAVAPDMGRSAVQAHAGELLR